jgi:hypothetical protein
MAFAEGSFWSQDGTYIVGYLLLSVLRPLWRWDQQVRADALQRAFSALCAVRFVLAYILIFSDGTGSGNMFAYNGVLELFRSKGDGWVVGLWIETCTLFMLLTLALIHDGERRRLPIWCTHATVLSGFFLSGLGFVLHLVFAMVCKAEDKQSEHPESEDQSMSKV